MSIWDGIEKADIYERGNYFGPNFMGVVKILKTLSKETRNKGLAFIVELEVLDTNNDETYPVGSKWSWYQGMKDKDIAFSAIAEWAAAMLGVDPTNKKQVKAEVMPELKDVMDAATNSPKDNDFIGMTVGLETRNVKKRDGGDFTRHNWHPLDQD